MNRRQQYALLAAIPVFLVIIGVGTVRWLWPARFYVGYDPSTPLNPAVVARTQDARGYILETVTFQTLPGTTTSATFSYPADTGGPFPCVVALLWLEAEREYIDMFADAYLAEGIALFVPDGLGFKGESSPPSGLGPVRELYALQRIRRSVVEARRSIDYLETRPEIDAQWLYFYGISVGAMIGPPLFVQEERFRAGVLAWGAGDVRQMLDFHIQRKNMGVLERGLFRVALPIFEPADPILWVDQVAPRPLLFQNARMDDAVPVGAITALHERAREPKTIVWYDSLHNQGVTQELVFQTLEDQIVWLKSLE